MRDPNLTMDDILGHSWKKELTGWRSSDPIYRV
jgi:hypothetical protein